MQRAAAGGLPNLFPAGKAVRHDQNFFLSGSNRGQERLLSDFHRHLVVILLETESAGHAAAAAFRDDDFITERLQDPPIAAVIQNGVLVAVGLENNLTCG